MLNLDAATVLLQWSVGGLLFLWVTSRRREVGIGYGWLGFLPLYAFTRGETARNAAYLMIPLGGLLEWGQSFVPGRASSMMDAVANAVGVFLGMWLAETVLARWQVCRGLRQE